MEKFNPADRIQDLQYFGEFGGVNPSISDSSTYTFLSAKTMFDTFEGNAEGCYLYSRHSSPSNLYLDKALAAMEGTESANVAASGMGAITPTLLQLLEDIKRSKLQYELFIPFKAKKNWSFHKAKYFDIKLNILSFLK